MYSKLQLKPESLGDSDGAEWLSSVWHNDVHTPVVSTFLMSVKATRMFAALDGGHEGGSSPKLVLALEVPKQFEQVCGDAEVAGRARRG